MATFSYFPHTEDDIREMLQRIGVSSIDDLYNDVPGEFLYKGEYDLPDAMSEQQIREHFAALGSRNTKLKIFAGAGAYDHYTPSVVPYLAARSEFSTAYTPYQAEISQGTLRYIFEYQSMICELTGMEISNASMYDGPTAAAEAMFMAIACTKKKTRVLLSDTLLPNVRKVVETYARFHGVALGNIAQKDGQTSLESLKAELETGDVAGIIVPAVNRFGIVEDFTGFADAVHEAKAIVVEYCDPSVLAVIKTPGEWGFDVAVGDGQSLGLPLNYGGPYVGFMACAKEHVRKLPGRIVGQTVDAEGKRCFVLTLQAREQHIRREKATSNICSNESLMALYVTIYLSLMGPEGMHKVNSLSSCGAHYLHDELLATGKFEEVFTAPFVKEFVLKPLFPAEQLQQALLDAGYFGALATEEGYVSFCVTEKRTKAEIDGLVNVVKGL
ncbi:MAG: aminomethyl-transferring glycine dehydrogenase subunit GcvPA [Candidatus Cryptobacteroides sp.]|nr:aminomethyl-transferring glycine dehydrogenase subunit GcvPA [Candidatus Cryptobacteroides sp.]